MKNINKSFYIIIFLIAFILLGMYLYLNQTDSEENINVSENNTEVEKIISQKGEQTSSNPKIEEDQNNLPKTDEIEESQPKEIRIVAEEILYPDEYDFGDSMSEITLVVGKPIKFDARPLIHAKQGDLIEIDLNGKVYDIELNSIKINNYTGDETDSGKPESTIRFYSPNNNTNKISGSITHGNSSIVRGRLSFESLTGIIHVYIHKDIAYHIDEYERQKEFYKRGYKLD